MPQVEFRDVQPQAAMQFFDAKSLRESFDWREVWQEEHARQFTVAKSAGRDILGDVYGAVQDAIKGGTTFDDFKKQLTPVLQAKGWWGKTQEIDPATGQVVSVQLGSPRRLATIYDTNISMAYAAGRWDNIQKVKGGRPYLMYDHLEGQEHPRPLHASWNGLTLPVDHVFWRTHYPPNGWHCHCSVVSLSQAQYDRMNSAGQIKTEAPAEDLRDWTNKRTGQTIKVPAGIDPGFGYNVGVAHVRELTPPPISGAPGIDAGSQTLELYPVEGRPAMPAPRATPADAMMKAGLSDQDYIDAFMGELQSQVRARTGDDQFVLSDGAVVKDPIGLPMALSDRFFITDQGESKIDPARSPFMKLLAQALLDPDEIWMSFEPAKVGGYQLRRRYVARFLLPGSSADTVVVIEESKDGWRGVTAFSARNDTYLDNQVRLGWLAYQRPN